VHAQMTAGAALAPVYGFPSEHPVPTNEANSHLACFVAKVAQWAAQAASVRVEESANAAMEAFGFLRQVAEVAQDKELLPVALDGLAGLCRVASRGRWNDQTPVPPEVFDLLSEDPPIRPWWRIW